MEPNGGVASIAAVSYSLLKPQVWPRTLAHALPEPIIRPEQGDRPIYSAHALDRMAQRKVTPEQVEAVLRDPEIELPGTKPGRRAFIKHVDGRSIKVVVAAGSHPPSMITVVAD